jgi:hypothetical protein
MKLVQKIGQATKSTAWSRRIGNLWISNGTTTRLREANNEREAPMYNSQLQVIFVFEGLNNG